MKKIGPIAIGFVLGATVMVLLVSPFLFFRPTTESPSRVPGGIVSSSVSSQSEAVFVVTHVADGDTIDVRTSAGKIEHVRLIGIDTPETVDSRKKVQCYGPEASERMKKLVLGKTVTLTAKPDEDHDSYGRLLRYVFLGEEDIGALMINEGYAVSLCHSFPHPKCDVYDAFQQQAVAEHRGRWAVCVK